MKILVERACIFIFVCAVLQFFCGAVCAQDFGLTLMEEATTNVNGSGIRVGQPEAAVDTNNDWEVDPAHVGQPTNLFTWYSNALSSTTYTNSLGGDSWHADNVGGDFYGIPGGVATNVAHVDNAYADDYYSHNIADLKTLSGNITDAVVNQSYTFGQQSVSEQETLDSQYDNYSMQYNTLFISAANNGGSVSPPGTSYDCISVGAYGGSSSYGPTIDNGRCKPDMTAPGAETSFSTPLVAGAAAALLQAGLRGDGGSDTNSAARMVTAKALLLNGTVKPADWSNIPPEPLNTNYGAGVLNIFNSYEELAGGKHVYNYSTNIPMGTSHLPIVTSASVPVLSGWDYNTNTSTSSDDAVNHYFFNVTNISHAVAFTLTATLVWDRHQSTTGINNLMLFLYNAANSNLVSSSTSAVDNVQHVYIPRLPTGRYDLQVWKAGGKIIVSTNEPYALAWAFVTQTLKATASGANIILSWPVYPGGFALESGTSLTSAAGWTTNDVPLPGFTNNQNVVTIGTANGAQFFRLRTPDF